MPALSNTTGRDDDWRMKLPRGELISSMSRTRRCSRKYVPAMPFGSTFTLIR